MPKESPSAWFDINLRVGPKRAKKPNMAPQRETRIEVQKDPKLISFVQAK